MKREIVPSSSTKHLLTAFHCLMAAVLTPFGLMWANVVSSRTAAGGFAVALAAVIVPVLIATRVAWASGYAAGRRDV